MLLKISKPENYRYGYVREITAVDYVQEVNKAGEDVFVILHLYKQGVPLAALVNEYLNRLAPKFPTTKFLKAISTTCIPNYPDKVRQLFISLKTNSQHVYSNFSYLLFCCRIFPPSSCTTKAS